MLGKALKDPALKRWAEIILQEAVKGERAPEVWGKSHEKGKMDLE